MLKIKKMVKNGRYLDIYIKKPRFNSAKLYYNLFYTYLDMENYNFDVMYSKDNKYIIAKFILRNREDIEPYIEKVGSDNE